MKKFIFALQGAMILGSCLAQASAPAPAPKFSVKKLAQFIGVRENKFAAYLQEKKILVEHIDSVNSLDSLPPIIGLALKSGEWHTITRADWQKMALNPAPETLEQATKKYRNAVKKQEQLCTIL